MLPHAFEDTLLRFVPDATLEETLAARRLAERVYEEEARIKDGVIEALGLLADHFALYLVTVGDEAVQRRRIETLPCRELFSDMIIVSDKTTEVYRSVLERGPFQPGEAVMIGDSLRSDVLPALEAGLFAVHIPADNWRAREMQGVEIPGERFARHGSLLEAARFLTGQQVPAPRAISDAPAKPRNDGRTGPAGPGL
jgi:putative hydrolase of the HAD superfamily